MKERITREQDTSADIESILGNFTLHTPRDLQPPRNLPARLSKREYGHERDPNQEDCIPLLIEADLHMLPGEHPWEATIVGTIDFDNPTACARSEKPLIGTNIETNLLRALRNDKDKPTGREILYGIKGITIKDPSCPAVVARVIPDMVTSRLELVATVERDRHMRSAYKQLVDIQAVAEQWVELQDWITKISGLPYETRENRHIYLDMDNDTRVSEVEFALVETMASWPIESVPRWADDIDSRVLARYGDPVMNVAPEHMRHTMPHELIVEIRRFAEMTGDMQALDQGAIINALGRFVKSGGRHRK